jgi:uncharacterized protein
VLELAPRLPGPSAFNSKGVDTLTLSPFGTTSPDAMPLPFLRALLFALAAGLASPAFAKDEPQSLPTLTLNAGMHNIRAQIASTPDQRTVGLMFRQTMAAHEGMLFVFEEPATQCFWMKNTLLPLSAAFVADDGTIVNIEDMKPQTLDSHCSKKPVRYVLEMNQGWFAKVGVKPGFKLSGQPFQPR